MSKHKLTGLIGYPLSHSFSKSYFTEKFKNEGLDEFSYHNFEIADINQVIDVVKNNPNLIGLNVTIPYKESVIPFLDDLSKQAKDIGAVNTICIDNSSPTPRLIGHNTDHIGFGKSIHLLSKDKPKGALILGTGGASKAAIYFLKNNSIKYISVSRSPGSNITYKDIDAEIINDYPLIINTSPVGMYPKIDQKPNIPYHLIGQDNLLFDLIYNPDETLFLTLGKKAGASILNGLPMLKAQAEASWELWKQSITGRQL